MTKEEDELRHLGLPLPENVEKLSDDERLAVVSKKKQDAPSLPTLVERVAKNVDPPAEKVTPEDLRKRAEEQQLREEKLLARREQIFKEDREFQANRWKSIVPPAFDDAEVTSLPEELSVVATEWLLLPNAAKRNVIIYGAPGRGKTFTGYAIARELFINRQKLYVGEAPEMLTALRPNAIEPLSLEKLKRIHYLMIDDLGTEKDSEFVQEVWFKIADFRWKQRLPMIVTTNLTMKEIVERYGERTGSRLLENALLIKITGDNRRV